MFINCSSLFVCLLVLGAQSGEEVKVAKEVLRDDAGAGFDSFRDEIVDNYMDKGCCECPQAASLVSILLSPVS